SSDSIRARQDSRRDMTFPSDSIPVWRSGCPAPSLAGRVSRPCDSPAMSVCMTPIEIALQEAREAAARGEVPVGAVVTSADGTVLARASNRVEELNDPSAHAEILALRIAAALRGSPRLPDCTLTVTLEPCP